MEVKYRVVKKDSELRVNWWLVEWQDGAVSGEFKTCLDVSELDPGDYFLRIAKSNQRPGIDG